MNINKLIFKLSNFNDIKISNFNDKKLEEEVGK